MSGTRKRQPGPAADCSDEDFLRAWRLCESAAQVDRRLGKCKGYSKHRADRLRARGVVLPAQEVT